jgi:hypothetical protein
MGYVPELWTLAVVSSYGARLSEVKSYVSMGDIISGRWAFASIAAVGLTERA